MSASKGFLAVGTGLTPSRRRFKNLLFEAILRAVLAWVLAGFELSAIEPPPIQPVFHGEVSPMPKHMLRLRLAS
jgi:hypothetical protein